MHARIYCEPDPFVELRAVDALIQIERDLAPVIGVQSIAFPEEGWFRTEGTMEAGSAPWIERAIERGCDADLVVFDAHSVPKAILHQAARLLVLKHGRRMAGTFETPPD
ncbi:MAG: hypothetical protein EXR27_03120 [Betaproteobacteria bacterium]|nr:hypothetical protein [Betaproteobacteria bacterium]